MELYDVVYHDIFKYGMIIEMTRSYCTVLFENNVKKMIITDEKHNSKYLIKASQFNLSSLIEKGLYNGLFKSKNNDLDEVSILNVLPNEILSSWRRQKITIKLQNASLTCYCEACLRNNCDHVFSTFKKYERNFLVATNPLLDEFKRLADRESMAIISLESLKDHLLEIQNYELFINQFCKKFERFFVFTNVYYLLGICMMCDDYFEETIFQAINHQNNYIYRNFKIKYDDLKNYCKTMLQGSEVYRLDIHKYYLLYLIIKHDFKELVEDMFYRLKHYNVIPLDEIILQKRTIDLALSPKFFDYYLEFSKLKNIRVDLKSVLDTIPNSQKKDFILKSQNISLLVENTHLFNDEERIKIMEQMIKNQEVMMFLDYIIQLYPLLENKEAPINEILKLLTRMYQKNWISLIQQDKVNQFLNLLPHNTYLHDIFSNHNPLIKGGGIDE